MKNKSKYFWEFLFQKLFMIASIVSVISLAIILGFVFYKGLPIIKEIGFFEFIFGTVWQPQADIFGILPMIVGSITVTLGTIILAVPIGILTAVYLSYIAPKKVANMLRKLIDMLASIPSVVFGFFGLMVIVPIIDKTLANGAGGNSMLASIIILAIMILPTIISVSENALTAVPKSYKEASLALGANEITTIFKVMIPAAKSGIFSGVILGVGRAMGEAMAVILVSGNAVKMPTSILSSVRTLSANCALEMGYASGTHSDALYATGVILFLFIILLNIAMYIIKQKSGKKG